jgi:hypothetical protein
MALKATSKLGILMQETLNASALRVNGCSACITRQTQEPLLLHAHPAALRLAMVLNLSIDDHTLALQQCVHHTPENSTGMVLLCSLMCCCRFQRALESAKHDEDMWVLLANANIHDAKARKVSSTIRSSSSSRA